MTKFKVMDSILKLKFILKTLRQYIINVECYKVYGKSTIVFLSLEMYFYRVVHVSLYSSAILKAFFWREFRSSHQRYSIKKLFL